MIDRIAVWVVCLVSNFFRSLGWRACRFHPTCSEYSSEAFVHFGGWRALFLSLARLARCHPLCRGGFDPLPKKEI